MLLVATVVSLLALVSAADKSYCGDLSTQELLDFIKGDAVRVVYFYKSEHLQEKSVKDGGPAIGHSERGASWEKFAASTSDRLLRFFKACETASRELGSLHVQLGRVGCGDDTPPSMAEYCDRLDVGYEVHGFLDGKVVKKWNIEHMQDVDAIVSNILQLVLKPEIVTLDTKQDRQDEEIKSRGKRNFILAYHKSAGNYEHRVFAEVAHAFRNSINFGATTDYRVVHDLPWYDQFDRAAIWVFYCKEAKPGHPCQVVKYTDMMNLASLTHLAANLDLPVVFEEKDGEDNPFEAADMHQVVLFFNNALESHVRQDVALTMAKLRGLFGLVLVNVDQTDYGFDPSDKLPTVAIKLRGSNELKFKDSNQTPIQFLAQEFGPFTPTQLLKQKLMDMFGGGYYDPLEDYNDRSFDPYVEMEDSPIAQEEHRMKMKSPADLLDYTNMPELTDETFDDTIQNSDMVIVLFHNYIDVRSLAVIRSLLDAANILAKEGRQPPLAFINCFDYTYVCTRNNIIIYPTIRIYRKGQDFVEYDGVFGIQPFISAVKLWQSPAPVELTSSDDAKKFTEGSLPAGIGAFTDTAVLGLFSDNQKQDIASFKETAEKAHGTQLYGLATGDLANRLADQYDTKTPSVVVYKRSDKFQPFTTSAIDADKILDASEPIFPELTASNFLEYWTLEKPFVLLISDKSESALHDKLGNLVKDNHYPDLTLGWINTAEVGSPGARILLNYDSTAALPVLALVNHEKGTVHLKDEATVQGAVQWIDDVLAGNVLPKSILSQHKWTQPRNPGYNMLKFTDEAEAKLKREADAMAAVRKTNGNKAAGGRPLNPEEEELRLDLLQMGADPDHHPTFGRDTGRHSHTEL